MIATTETTTHQPWCGDKEDEGPGHECSVTLYVDASRYPPVPQRNGDWQRAASAHLALDAAGEWVSPWRSVRTAAKAST